MFAIIGGSGLVKLSALEAPRRRVMRTPYGEPSGALTFGLLAGSEVVFLARHGYGQLVTGLQPTLCWHQYGRHRVLLPQATAQR